MVNNWVGVMGRILSFSFVVWAISTVSFSAHATKVETYKKSPELFCLAQNIYFEARGEPLLGKIAVGHVVLNRVADKRFPGHVCKVIQQGGHRRLHRCQFSWWCDGKSDDPQDVTAWYEAVFVAHLIRKGVTIDPTKGALWYHAVTVRPNWANRMRREAKIGQHIFYTKPKRRVSRSSRSSKPRG
ncbi:MAG: cell wall hydrolase [Alphaproteobacteria bacterium]|nr:cell wall hydrolase [Alphaproteobacteria bacterium]